jgi:site-specific recombinase XerD
MTFAEAISRYQRALHARGLSLESQKNYTSTVAGLHKQTGDAWPTYPVLVDWLSSMDVAKTTMHHRTANVKRFFAWCVDMEYIEKDPAAKLIVPKRGKNNPVTLSVSQVEFLLGDWTPYYTKRDAFLAARDKALVRLFIMTGLRRAELSALNVGDVNVEGRAIAVRSGKGDKDRTVMVPGNVQPELRALTLERNYDEPLFIGKNIRGSRKRLAPDAISYIFTRKVSPAMGRRVTPHMCRHSYATMLVNKGVPLNQIQQLMGHSSLATTQIYLHASGRELRNSVEVLDEIA